MKYGLMLPYSTPTDRKGLLGWATAADAAGFSTVTTGERMTYGNMEQIVALSAAAAVTSKVRILANILIVPMHAPGILAKRLASLDVLSEGRFVMAAGVGDREQDYRAGGATMERRWPRADETILTMKRLWKGEPLVPGDDPIGPSPYTPGGPELWIGSRGPKALARAARWGATGFAGFTLNGEPGDLKAQVDAVNEAWAANGRTDRPYLFVSCFYALGDDAVGRMAGLASRYWAGWADNEMRDQMIAELSVTNPDSIHRLIENVEAAGYDELNFLPITDDLADFDRLQAVLGTR
jgi:alkanesulfonate monooxygenase SsuD/methylene tetrahydromethanopterin reductase-like flavin-dependent oxidoreductase (luciferase family)